jgi:alpha-D-xyloside xylohydrolase
MGQDAAFTLYEDEGVNYHYEKGAFSQIPISYNESTKELTIGDRRGSFAGMLQRRRFRIVWISKSTAQALDPDVKPAQEVTYSGKRISVISQQ